jgi:hypothetical protein
VSSCRPGDNDADDEIDSIENDKSSSLSSSCERMPVSRSLANFIKHIEDDDLEIEGVFCASDKDSTTHDETKSPEKIQDVGIASDS